MLLEEGLEHSSRDASLCRKNAVSLFARVLSGLSHAMGFGGGTTVGVQRRLPSGFNGWPVGLAGESYYQAAIARCVPGQGVALIPEPTNSFDRRAIMVWSEEGEQIGYVPRDSWVADALLDEGDKLHAVIASMHGERPMRAIVLDVWHGSLKQ